MYIYQSGYLESVQSMTLESVVPQHRAMTRIKAVFDIYISCPVWPGRVYVCTVVKLEVHSCGDVPLHVHKPGHTTCIIRSCILLCRYFLI